MFSFLDRISKLRPSWAGFRNLVFIVLFMSLIGGALPEQGNASIPIHVAVMLERVNASEDNPGTEAAPTFADSLDAKRGAELCAREINTEWQSQRIGLELKPVFYYDGGSAANMDAARTAVGNMIADGHAVAVVGHAISQISVEMGQEFYQPNGIPAITASAVNNEITIGNPWYFRALPNSSLQSEQMANYIYKVLKEHNATVIELEADTFSQEFSTEFRRRFRNLGGQIQSYHTFKIADVDSRKIEIVQQIKEANDVFLASGDPKDDPGVIVFVMRAPEAARFVQEIRNASLENTLFGPSALANQNFPATLKTIAGGKDPNLYSNGVYALAPVVYDTAGSVGQDFLKEFRQQYGEIPGMKAATNCDALKLIAQAVINANITGDPALLKEERVKVRDALSAINSSAVAVEGVTGSLYFDDDHNPVKPIDVSVYQDGERISARYQFVEIDPETAERLIAQGQSEVVRFDNRYFSITNVVYVGVDINEVSDLDIQEGTYVLDFYIWFRGREAVDPNDFEFIAADEPIEFGDPVVKKDDEDGETFYRAYQVKAKFKLKGDSSLKSYPFDSQILGFEIKSKTRNAQGLLLALDTIGMRGITEDEFLKRLAKQKVIQSLGGAWTLGSRAKISQEESRNDSTLGIPGVTKGGTSIPYSRFVIEFEVRRNGITYSLKNFLPMMFLVGLALMAFFSDAKDYSKMYDVVTSVILTAAFFQLGLTDSLPNIGYTTALDWMFYLVYFLCILQIVIILQIKRYVEDGKEAVAARIVYISRFVYVILVVLGGYIIYLSNWSG